MKKASGHGGASASSAAARSKAAFRQMMKAEQQRQQAAARHHQTTQSGEQAAHGNAHHRAQAPSAAPPPPPQQQQQQPSRGVLRKSKYGAAQISAAAKHDDGDGDGDKGSGGLANLLGGYDSSGSSSSDEEGTNNGSLPNANGRGPTAASVATEEQIEPATTRSAPASSDMMISAAASVALETSEEVVERPIDPAGGKDAMDDDDAWREFEDLVGGDDDNAEEESKPATGVGDGIQEEEHASAAAATGPVDTDDAAQSAVSALTSAAPSAVDSSEVEQAAYEARLGRLMMLRVAAKAQQGAGGSTNDDPAGTSEALRDVEYASAGFGFGEEEDGAHKKKEATGAKRGQDDNSTANRIGSASSALASSTESSKASKKRGIRGLSSGSSSALAIMKRKKAKAKQIATKADVLAEYGEDDQGGFA